MKKILFYITLSFTVLNLQAQLKLQIPEIQGSSVVSPHAGKFVETTGIVTAKFTGSGTINGFFLQDKDGDKNPNTSDAIFVYSPNNSSVKIGDKLRVQAVVSEYYGRTQLSEVNEIAVLSQNNSIEPIKISYNLNNWDWERFEGMLIEFEQTLWVNSTANLERYGELELGIKRRPSPTNAAFPASSAYNALLSESGRLSIYLDDAYTTSYKTPIVLADKNGVRRTGERVDKLRAVVDYTNNRYTLYPAETPVFYGNSRSATHDDIGDYNVKVCGFNLEYYLTSPNSTTMGPSNLTELNRQHEKIMAALRAIDADVYALAEIEQGQAALQKLVDALNMQNGKKYDYVRDGSSVSGTYTKVGYIYRSDKIEPYKSLREINRPTPINRKKIQAFTHRASGERFILSVNHFKAKSGCSSANGDDIDQGDGQSCFNGTRVEEANAVIAALESAKAFYDDDDVLIMGDLNAYALEDPIQQFIDADYVDLLRFYYGDNAYSYVYRAEAGVLDHALANKSLIKQVTGTTVFHINADELASFEYGGNKSQPDMYRCSDHDPVIVGLALGKNVNSGLLEFEERVQVYPAVIQDKLHIDYAESAYVQIYSLSGLMVYQAQIESNKFVLSLKDKLPAGAYLVRVLGEGKIVRQMVFLQ